MKLSVMIIAKNEQKMIADCIKSVDFADEIIIIDDYSSDKTAAIAKEMGARVYKKKLNGFATQKNYGIKRCSNNWVFILDADERVDSRLAETLKKIKAKNSHAAFKVPRKNYIKGKWIRHGGLYPDYQVRLIDKTKCKYGQREVHEMLEIDGTTALLKGDIIHFTYDSLGEYYDKVCKYAKLESKWLKSRPSILAPYIVFIKKYFVEKGFLDGTIGLASALYLAKYQSIMRSEFRK
jgi:glycosyltransferase involved in cell wall biosynthesis